MNSYQHKRDMHHAAPFDMFAGLEPSQALKTYTLTYVREHGHDTAFHYQLCILETTREHVKSKKIHWLLLHLPSCLPYTVRNDQFLNSLY